MELQSRSPWSCARRAVEGAGPHALFAPLRAYVQTASSYGDAETLAAPADGIEVNANHVCQSEEGEASKHAAAVHEAEAAAN